MIVRIKHFTPRILFLLLFVAMLDLSQPASNAYGVVELNKYQSEYLQKGVEVQLRRLLDDWRLYNFDFIYDELGSSLSKSEISKDEFVTRLSSKNWAPAPFKESQIIKTEYISLSHALIEINIVFNNRHNKAITTSRKIILNLVYEETANNRVWLFDLFPILQAIA